VLLVRHSVPELDPAVPADEWRLSEEGRTRCGPLAQHLAAHEPNRILSSTEPKARETAELVGARLGLDVELSDALREHARRSTGWLGRGELERCVRRLFDHPDEIVFGEESAAAALARFSAAVGGLDGRAIVVSHGTVISLYAAACTGGDAFEVWRGLELPDLVIV
jgi:broad specificity phosphatase PhoE